MKVVAGVDAMNSDNHYKNIKKVQEIIEKEIFSNDFDLETLIEINDKLTILIDSLNYWIFQNNPARYYYDIKSFLSWVREKK